uniref:Green Fluorescent Protein Variant \
MSMEKQVLKENMKTTYHMDGSVDGHYFEIEGEGTGNPFKGEQELKLRVTKGGPLPFAFDILSPTFTYGNRVFTDYPEDMPDYFKQSLPEGYSWERTMMYEDGATATASARISLDKNGFVHKSTFHGENFPANGPVMKKKGVDWEPSSETITPEDGILKGDVEMFLVLEGGQRLKALFQTTYKANKVVKMPPRHKIEHRLVRSEDGETIQLQEHAVAKYFTE